MNIGITFGTYCPLHQGHMDLIMQAKKENDITFVFVCGYDDDRGGDILPLQKRFRIISNFLTDDTVIVCKINDTELGLDESMSDSNWKIWMSEVVDQIRNKLLLGKQTTHNFNWYVGEQSYVSAIKRNWQWIYYIPKVAYINRIENPVSGTLCRTEPLKHWNKITTPFRSYFSHNILIAGTASEGKSTLTRDIGKYFNLPYSYEKGRDICKIKTDNEFTVKDFIYNIYEQNKYNEELICSPQNPGVFISDTDNMVTLMYAWSYKNRSNFALKPEDYQLLEDLARVYSKTVKWDKIFLLKPSTQDITDDGERYMPDSDYNIRRIFYDNLRNFYDNFGYKYEELEGRDYYNNFLKVKNYINNLYKD